MTKSKGPPLRARRKKTKFSAQMMQKVCDDLATGMSYAQVGAKRGRPCSATIYNWRREHPEFAAAADAARAFGAEFCADRALEVAEQATEETVRKAKLHVDALMQRAALLAPLRWGGRSAGAAKPEPVEVIFRMRHFERVEGADGKAFLREIKPENDA